MTQAPVLELERCAKSYGPVRAVDEISMVVNAGEVHCLLGDNGAGKSTVVKMLAGVVAPSAGTLRFDGEPAVLGSPRSAGARGIATVHQDVGLFPLMSVWRNFFVGRELTRGMGPMRWLDGRAMRQLTTREIARFRISGVTNPDMAAGALSGGQRQGVAIARALHFGAKLLILDEPTAALGVREAEKVVQFMVHAKEEGAAVVFVTHNPRHAILAGDRFTVLRHGRVIGAYRRGEIDYAQLVQLMSGIELGAEQTDEATLH